MTAEIDTLIAQFEDQFARENTDELIVTLNLIGKDRISLLLADEYTPYIRYACNRFDISVVRILVELTKEKSFFQDMLTEGFNAALESGRLDIVGYLAEEALERGCLSDILKVNVCHGFRYVCKKGDLRSIEYIAEIAERQNCLSDMLEAHNFYGFSWACIYGYVGIAKYLVEAAKEQGCLNRMLEADVDNGFAQACEHNNIEIVKYLVEVAKKQGCFDKMLANCPNALSEITIANRNFTDVYKDISRRVLLPNALLEAGYEGASDEQKRRILNSFEIEQFDKQEKQLVLAAIDAEVDGKKPTEAERIIRACDFITSWHAQQMPDAIADVKSSGVWHPLFNGHYGNEEKHIIALTSFDDLRSESSHLNHCVGTSSNYAQKCLDGVVGGISTHILSIRDSSGIPNSTIEVTWDGSKLTTIQHKGKYDGTPSIEDKNLYAEFIEAIEKDPSHINQQFGETDESRKSRQEHRIIQAIGFHPTAEKLHQAIAHLATRVKSQLPNRQQIQLGRNTININNYLNVLGQVLSLPAHPQALSGVNINSMNVDDILLEAVENHNAQTNPTSKSAVYLGKQTLQRLNSEQGLLKITGKPQSISYNYPSQT